MSFQENKKTAKNKLLLQQHFTFHAFHPKAVNTCLLLAGLLASRLLNVLPIPFDRNSGCSDSKVCLAARVTATGIAPELHRTSLLIIWLRQMNQ
jgi:hypothetical protein